MNKQNAPNIPDEKKIEELLEKMRLIPSEKFHKKIEQAPWRNEQVKQKMGTNKQCLKLAVVIVVFLAIIILAITPQGHAWTQEVFQFFKQVNFTTIPLSD